MVCVWQYDYECFKLSKYLENPHAFVFKIYPKMESLKFQYWGLNEISFYLFIYLFFFAIIFMHLSTNWTSNFSPTQLIFFSFAFFGWYSLVWVWNTLWNLEEKNSGLFYKD